MDQYVVIMAGGVGSRFWPLSREKKPKQFLSADEGKCMLIQTIERVCEVVPPKNCFIITNKNLLDITQQTIKNIIPYSNIIEEPLRKNTAACIAYATLFLKQKFGSGLLSFIPADGYVKDKTNYVKALNNAYIAAERTKNIVTIGINPTFPSTGYGYIHIAMDDKEKNDARVLQFVEKPDLETAKGFVASKEYLWNSGIVLGDMDVLIDNIKLFIPNHYNKLAKALINWGKDNYNTEIEKAYQALENTSFDVGVLEKSSNIQTVKGWFDWNDIGSMDALSKTLPNDEKGNSIRGDYFGLETSNSVIYSEGMLIATIGIDNMIVACTKDAIIVCPKDMAQDIKLLVQELKQNGYKDFT